MRPLILAFAIAAVLSTSSFAQNLGPETPLAPATYGTAPSYQVSARLAATAGGFFAAWSDTRGGGAVYGARLDRHGNLLDPLSIRLGTAAPVAPLAVAAAGTDAVVVINRCASIDFVRVSADGVAGTPRSIAADGVGCQDVEIATNGTTFLVVWSQRAEIVDGDGRIIAGPLFTSISRGFAVASDGKDYLIAGMSDSSAGAVVRTVIGGSLGAMRPVSSAPELNGVAIASDGQRYLVLTTGSGMQATIVSADGTEGSTAGLSAESSSLPRVAWNGREFVAAFGQPAASDVTMHVARLAADGHLVGGSGAIDEIGSLAQSLFDVAGTDDGALLAWSHNKQFGTPLVLATVLSDASIDSGVVPAAINLARSAADERSVRLLRAGAATVAFWRETTTLGSRLVAALLDSEGRARSAPVDLGILDPYSYRVAFDGTDILVAWSSEATISMLRFTTSMTPLAAPIAITEAGSLDFDLATGNRITLIAWSSPGTDLNSGRIDGALVRTSDAMPEPQPLAIGSVPTASSNPAVAWNGREFLVSWAHRLPFVGDPPGPLPQEIRGARVTPDGRLADLSPLTIAQPNMAIFGVAAASNGNDFYVVWAAYDLAHQSIAGAHVAADGTTPGGTGEQLSASGSGARDPIVTTRGSDYVVAWNAGANPYFNVEQVEVRIAGRPQPAISIPTPQPAPTFYTSLAASVFEGPSLVATDTGLLVAYNRVADDALYGGVARTFTRTVEPFAPQPRRRAF